MASEAICYDVKICQPARPALVALAYSIISHQNFWFVLLFIFRYLRLIVHIISFNLFYRPAPIPQHPTVHTSDCTVIVPTVDPGHARFSRNLASVLVNCPRAIIVVTVGKSNLRRLERTVAPLRQAFPQTTIHCSQTNIANKRHQVCHAVPHVRTQITVLVDDSVYWPSSNFLHTAVAPFESPRVGCVGTHKRVIRDTPGLSFKSFFNFLGCIYLERHNFEIRATNAIDGGVFVVSGRTSLIRSAIIQAPDFISGFTNERFFFGMFGPLNADDDNFITRWLVKHGWDIKIQYGGDATIETHLGTYPRFFSQVLRWTRTTWRSNPCSLFTDRIVWYRQPWCLYAVYLTSLVNFALFYDVALMYTFSTMTFVSGKAMWYMAAWIFASKMVKLIPHFRRCPADIIFIPGYILFAYYHSLIKLYALFTFYVTAWGGRNLAAVGTDESDSEFDDNLPDLVLSTALPVPCPNLNSSRETLVSSHSTASWEIHSGSDFNPSKLATDNPKGDFTSSCSPGASSYSSWYMYSPRNGSFRSYIPDSASSKTLDASTRNSSLSSTPLSFTRHVSKRGSIPTPWGRVNGGVNMSFTPANVLEANYGYAGARTRKKTRGASASASASAVAVAGAATSSNSSFSSSSPSSPSSPSPPSTPLPNANINRTPNRPTIESYPQSAPARNDELCRRWISFWSDDGTHRVHRKRKSDAKTFDETDCANWPVRGWWKESERDETFEFFEEKNEARERDAAWLTEGGEMEGKGYGKEWYRSVACGRLHVE